MYINPHKLQNNTSKQSPLQYIQHYRNSQTNDSKTHAHTSFVATQRQQASERDREMDRERENCCRREVITNPCRRLPRMHDVVLLDESLDHAPELLCSKLLLHLASRHVLIKQQYPTRGDHRALGYAPLFDPRRLVLFREAHLRARHSRDDDVFSQPQQQHTVHFNTSPKVCTILSAPAPHSRGRAVCCACAGVARAYNCKHTRLYSLRWRRRCRNGYCCSLLLWPLIRALLRRGRKREIADRWPAAVVWIFAWVGYGCLLCVENGRKRERLHCVRGARMHLYICVYFFTRGRNTHTREVCAAKKTRRARRGGALSTEPVHAAYIVCCGKKREMR